VVRTTPRPLYPRKRPGTHCTGGWVGPRTGLAVCEKSRSPDHPTRSQSLYRLSYQAHIFIYYIRLYIYLFIILLKNYRTFTLRALVYFSNRTVTSKLVANPFSFPAQDSANTALFLRKSCQKKLYLGVLTTFALQGVPCTA
jgi:hypothetical protein